MDIDGFEGKGRATLSSCSNGKDDFLELNKCSQGYK